MRLGLGQLRIPPAVLWSMTLRELEAAIAGFLGHTAEGTPCTRADLATLMLRYPD